MPRPRVGSAVKGTVVAVRVTEAEALRIDAVRGPMSRSQYIRWAIRKSFTA